MSKLRINELESLETGRSLKVDKMAQTFDYVAGVKITSYNQMVKDDSGDFWRVNGATELPYTLTGAGVNEGGALVSVGDAVLRGELSSASGSSLIGDADGTVKGRIDALTSATSDISKSLQGVSRNDNRGASVGLTQAYNDTRFPNIVGVTDSIVVLGDSISHGAFAGDLYRNGWVNVLKRMLSAEFGAVGYGNAPLHGLGSGATLSEEVHDVEFVGSWTGKGSTTGGEDIMQGISFTSNAVGNKIIIKCPVFQRYVRVWYKSSPTGGTFNVKINEYDHGDASTVGDTDEVYKSILLPMETGASGDGYCTATLEVTAGQVTICGVGYELANTTSVQNFSTSGRRLKPATETMIDLVSRSKTLIMALGYNDSGETDPAYQAAFKQRIDWLIFYCLKYNTTVVVPDFCWWSDGENYVRKELKRLADETSGIYIPLPDYLTRDGLALTEFSYSTYMNSTVKMWTDGAHPNTTGHKWIAEVVAKAMGLSVTSKKHALDYFDYSWPLLLSPTSLLKNSFATLPYISNSTQSGNTITHSISIETKSGEPILTGLNILGAGRAADRQLVQFPGAASRRAAHFGENGENSALISEKLNGELTLDVYASTREVKTIYSTKIIT